MNIFKKYLAMFLVICMLISVVPVMAFGAEADGAATEAPEATETVPEATDGTDPVSPLAGLVKALAKTEATEDDVAAIADNADVIKVELKVGESKTYTDNSGVFDSAETEPDTNFVHMTLKQNQNNHTVAQNPSTTLSNGTYLILNTRATKLVNNTSTSESAQAGNMNGLALSGTTSDFNATTAVWTITKVDGGYTVQDANDKYMTISSNSASVVDNEQVLSLSFGYHYDNNQTWNLAQNGAYLNDAAGKHTTASGWKDTLAATDIGSQFRIYAYSPASESTEITFAGVKPGTTTAVVGNTTYNITVTAENVVNVELKVGETKEYTDNTGNYENASNNVGPNNLIVAMKLEGITSEITYDPIYANKITYNSILNFDSNNWVATKYGYKVDGTIHRLYALRKTTNNTCYYGLAYSTTESINNIDVILINVDQYSINQSGMYMPSSQTSTTVFASDWGNIDTKALFVRSDADTESKTTITFTGVAPGTTTAFVGNTQYNITVTSLEQTVNIELEIGETFTYTDTTGVYTQTGDIKQNPDEAYATMKVAGASNATRTPVTAIESGKRYLIINKNTGELLTNKEVVSYGDYGPRDALNTVPENDTVAPELWTITESNGKYTVTQDGQYLAVAGFVAYMYDTETLLDLSYSPEGQGWKIYDGKTGPDLGHGEGGYYLSDNVGYNYGGNAQGTSDTNNNAAYWDIIEIPYTDVTFTGVAEGTTTAKVGYTTYNIIVVPQEVDDEVENTGTDIWTIDPEIQTQRITDATVENGTYTDDSWNAYETALNAANAKLVNIQQTAYTTQAEANSALAELTELVSALETAKEALVPGKPIIIRYWRLGEKVLEETIHVPVNSTTYDLEPTKSVNGVTYSLSSTKLNMAGNVSEFDISLLKENEAASGIVGETDISAAQVSGRPVNEMTVTVGINYDLGLADILADGQSVVWSSANAAVATVDGDGTVTAVAVGTTKITAAIMDGDNNVVKTYETTINVLPGVSQGTETRDVAVYIDQCDNTTAYCVLHANGAVNEFGDSTNKFNAFEVFEVSEGELIYGAFQRGNTEAAVAVENFTGLTFLGKPDDKHALAFMSSTNSAGDYMPLHDSMGKVVKDDGDSLGWGQGWGYYIGGYGSAKGLHDGLNDGLSTTGYTDDIWTGQIIPMAKYFTSLKYDGAMGFNRPANHGGVYTNLSFVSEPLPEIEKTVNGVLPTGGKFENYQRYVENMVAGVDEIVFFTITVTIPRPTVWVKENGTDKTDSEGRKYGAVVYSSVTDNTNEIWLVDELDGAYFYDQEEDKKDGKWDGIVNDPVNKQNLYEALNAPWADDETDRVLTFSVGYKIKEADVPKFNINNTVSLEYNYNSTYSSGAMNNTATADAKITVIHTVIDNVVIDFGQKIVLSGLTGDQLNNVYVGNQNKHAEKYDGVASKYGQVEVEKVSDNNYTVTYTPTSIMQGPDMVILYGKGLTTDNQYEDGKIINGFIVYPATTIYYEEGFAFPGNDADYEGWDLSKCEAATVEQDLEYLSKHADENIIVSGKTNNYGYDPVYDRENAPNGTYATTSKIGAKTAFTFTGDGIQVFARCTEETGYVSVQVKNSEGRVVRLSLVDTVVEGGTTEATNKQNGEMDGLPVVSLLNLEKIPHGTYTVTITKIKDEKPVYIDGIRVFNTVAKNPDNSPFTIDLEDNPEFYELRDAVLHAIGVENVNNSQYGSIAEISQQIYDSTKGATAIITDEKVSYGDSTTVQDLLDNGPKNELFIYGGQTLTFKVNTKRVMQVGLKAPRTGTKAEITVKDAQTNDQVYYETESINSSVDMFYTLVDKPVTDAKDYLVTIKNIGSDILSVTLLKICDDPNAAFVELTKDDIEDVLFDIYDIEDGPIAIVSQPKDAEGRFGETINVTVEAKGEGLKYKWYFRNAGAENWSVSSIKTNVYSVEMNKSRAGRELYCVISDANGNSVTTDIAKLIAVPGETLEIVKQPNDAEAKMGEMFNVEVIAKGECLTYKWYYRNKGSEKFVKSGVTDNTYDDVMTSARAGREVYCVITDAFGNSVTSDIAVIIALPDVALEITQQPVNSEAKMGERYMVEVIAKGDGLTYQWFFRNKGSEIWNKSSVTDNTYDDVMTSSRAGREVYCIITDACGNSVTTDTVKLILLPDLELQILQHPTDAEAKMGEMFCVEVIAQGDNLSYQWYYRNKGSEEFVKSGVRDNTYDDVMTKARAGREVYCVITDACGNSVTTEIAQIVAIPDETLEILVQPSDGMAKMGEMYMVEVVAKGDGLSYQWYFRNPGAKSFSKSGVKDNTYDDVMTAARAGREVYCVITDCWGNSVTTETVKLIVVDDESQLVNGN